MSNLVTLKRLGDIVNFKRGYDLPERERKDGSYPVISSSGISGYHSEYKVDGEGLITGRYGTLGEVYYINGKYWPHNTTLYVTDFKGNYPKYVYYLLKCLGNLKTSDKSTVPGINRNDLHEVEVPFIEREFQESVASVLSTLDSKISLNNRIKAELEAMAKTIYDYWFVQFDFPDRNGKPYKASGGKMVWSDELKREIPEGWAVKAIEMYAKFENGKGIGKDRLFEDGKYDVFGSNGIIGKTNDFLFEEPVIAIGRVGANYGEVNYTLNPSWISDNAITSQPVKREYFWWLLLSLKGINYSSISGGSAQPLITQGQLRQIKFAIPSDSIFNSFHNIVEPVYLKIHCNLQQNEKLTELRDWLLPMLMNGQIKIKDAERELAMAAEPEEVYKSKRK